MERYELLIKHRGSNDKLCLISLHGDGVAAKFLALEKQREYGCGLLLFRGESRCIKVSVNGGEPVLIDPNRIWTSGPLILPDGRIITNLDSHSLYIAVRNKMFWPARNFLDEFPATTAIIAMHNNGESFIDGELKAQAKEIFPANDKNPGDFIQVTKEADFCNLAGLGIYNIGLLTSRSNDGSLSVWAAHEGKRYFNIGVKNRDVLRETIKVQQKMLEKAISIL